MSQLEEFEVIVRVPEDFRFNGVVPYDMQLIAGQAYVSVPARSMEEAHALATEFFNGTT
jgi:hypothetical protein